MSLLLLPSLQCLPAPPSPAQPSGGGSTTGSENTPPATTQAPTTTTQAPTTTTQSPTTTTQAPEVKPEQVTSNPQKLQEDLACGCDRAIPAARAVSQALAQAGNNCGSGAGQALARE